MDWCTDVEPVKSLTGRDRFQGGKHREEVPYLPGLHDARRHRHRRHRLGGRLQVL